MITPTPEAIEAAADVIWMRANSENGVCGADRQTHSYAVATEVATDALTASYPLMEAQAEAKALREAADDAPGKHDEVSSLQECHDWADWLRVRAATIEGASK